MNDDLHDIDRLFKDGIDGHEEAVPPSVWEAVSNDLDKKQASYYKRKYQRLKRVAWLSLMLLLFAGGVYVVYKASDGKKEEPSVQNLPAKTTTTTSSSPNTAAPAAPNGPTKPEEEKERQDKTFSADTAAVSLPINTTEKREKEKSNGGTGVLTGINNTVVKGVRVPANTHRKVSTETNNNLWAGNPAVAPSGSRAVQRLRRELKTGEPRVRQEQAFGTAKENRRTGNKASVNPTGSASAQAPQPSFTAAPLTAKDYNSTAVSLQALTTNRLTILPQQPVTSKSKEGGQHGFSLSAFAAPNISFERLEDNDRLAGPGRNRQEARRQEGKNFSFSAGLLLTYNLTARWALQSGIGITSSSIALAPTDVYAKADNNGRTRYELHCASGYVYIDPKSGAPPVGDTAKTSGTVTKLTYLTVPASVSYQWHKGRFSLLPSAGIGLNFLTSGKTATTLLNRSGRSESTTASISGLKSTYMDGHFGLGLAYNLSKKLSIGLRPNARIALTPINKETPVQSYQNYLSMETGVRIKL